MSEPGTRPRPAAAARERRRRVFPCSRCLALLVCSTPEAWQRGTPWVFTDELEWTQISRAHRRDRPCRRRGEPIVFKSLYAYVDRARLVDRLHVGRYAAIKYRVLMMTAGGLPTLPAGSDARRRRCRSSP